MVVRHGLTLVGFESPGPSEATLHELLSVVEALLAKYPIDLRGIAITDNPSGAVRGDRGDGSADSGVWMILQSADSERHSSVVRAFGQALDIAGELRARGMAQHSLIGEYLRISGHRSGDRLSGVVSGYRRWRGQLPGCGSVTCRFDPATALAEAFVEVELQAAEASAPAKILHEVLVRTAQNRDRVSDR